MKFKILKKLRPRDIKVGKIYLINAKKYRQASYDYQGKIRVLRAYNNGELSGGKRWWDIVYLDNQNIIPRPSQRDMNREYTDTINTSCFVAEIN